MPQSRLLRYLLLFALLLALGGGGYWAYQKYNAPANALEQMVVSTVQVGDIEDLVTATGTIQPRDFVDVGAQVSGQLKKIHVEVGSTVKAGDLLAEIDPTVYAANVDGRRAQLRSQQASLAERESALSMAQIQLARQKNMLAGDATTVEQMQLAEASVRAATAQVAGVKAQIEQTQYMLRAEEANLNYAQIYSPINGVVVSINARQGQTLNANQQAPVILRVADMSTMTVQTQVSEADVSRLQPGMEVYFTTLGSRTRRWNSTLYKVEPTPNVNNSVVLYNALFDVVNDQRNLLPQMTAQVFFVTAAAKNVLLVPAGAIQRRAGERRNPGGNPGANRAPDPGPNGTPGSGAKPSDQPAAPTPASPALRQAQGEQNPQTHSPNAGTLQHMTREERRAALERMTPEQRQQYREQRQAQRGVEGKPNAGAPIQVPPKSDAGKPVQSATPATVAPTYPVWAGVAMPNSRQPREATVKVLNADGSTVERTVQIGISNRVQVQIISGLSEGERVVAGVKPPPGAQRAQRSNNSPTPPSGLTPPGSPPGGPNLPGAGRGR